MAKDQDKYLEEYLSAKSGISSLYAQRLEEEPPAEVDQAILQAARGAISRKTGSTGPFSGSWLVPAALAAVLVLAVGVTLTLEKHVDLKPAEVDRMAPASEALVASGKKKAIEKPQTTTEKKAMHNHSLSLDKPVPAVPARRTSPGTLTGPRPAMEPEPLRDDTDNAELLEKAPAADSGASMQSPSIEQQVMQPHEVKPLEAEPLQTEDRWIQSIRELVKQGNIDEAKKQLSDFRRIYPDYPVPEDLRNLN